MSTEKMREEFEAFASTPEFGLRPGHFVRDENGGYESFPTQCYWEVWQASRAAIEVELPSSARMYFNGAPAEAYTDGIKCWHDGVDAARRAIESLGLKVKP